MRKPHFSSLRLDWKTPKAVYQTLDAEFSFDFDPCPPHPDFDGLSVEWGESNFVNPPYGRELPKWIERGHAEWQMGKTVVFLIPSRTDTRWWHDYCMKATEIRYIKGRLKFDDQPNPAPFPSAVVIFRGVVRADDYCGRRKMTKQEFLDRCANAWDMGLCTKEVLNIMERQLDGIKRFEGGQIHYFLQMLEEEKARTDDFSTSSTLANDEVGYKGTQLMAILTHPCQECAVDPNAWHTRRAFCEHKNNKEKK